MEFVADYTFAYTCQPIKGEGIEARPHGGANICEIVSLVGVVGQVGAEPAFGFGEGDLFAGGVVFYLVGG